MTREELEHAIRAACDVAEDREVYVFGSQAILGQFPDAPSALRQSAEADIAPVHAVDKIDVIDATLADCRNSSGQRVAIGENWRRRKPLEAHRVPQEDSE